MIDIDVDVDVETDRKTRSIANVCVAFSYVGLEAWP